MTIAELLAELRDRAPQTWAAELRARYPGDPALVAQALIWLHAANDGDLPQLADDRYELGVLLDTGATAAVWQAYDRKLRRDVAIKLFRSSPVLGEILAEARAASEVRSDHVVRVLDVQDSWIVMELVGEYDPRGERLVPGMSAHACRPRDLDEAVRWVRDVARGVHDAHLRNVFHRDLKPHNVLIEPFSRRARIADFGLAIGGVNFAGTPAYIAPEQARGATRELDRAGLVGIDVWGLGALAFDLVGGLPPWRASGDREPWEVAAIAEAPPELALAPPRLVRIVGKAMAIDRSARYATAAELADELDAYLARRPTTFDRGWPVRLALWCRRNPHLTVTALLACVLAGLTATAYATILAVRGERNQLAVEMADARRANEQLAARAAQTRAELADTETSLTKQNAALTALRRTLADAKADYDAIVAAKERALHDADAATRQLVDQLASARADRDAAVLGRAMYEGFFTRARAEADQAGRDREQAVRDRDDARAERDRARQDRETARAELAKAEADRDAARAARDRAEAERRRVEAALADTLAHVVPVDAGVGDAPRD